ncbi:MAG TPA: ABC transporter substrate-binding protein [Syntrophorhabdaceae bacterium]|nr:ABC transporter substrate-binding protein [Syntrophorhabdaceae bacterium]HOL06440.1 ABC transporter substrate-binding protein [Syntrophorhabdaceae bacterium]HPP42755.1 ABC transporter substrate-binding protein [Syntrophorhabdaceae bacterium]
MRKLAVFILIAFFAISIFPAGSYAQAQKVYKIGGIFSLTGYLSWLGEYKKKAAELKVELINKAGGINGIPLQLISYDDTSSPEQASKVAQRLISKDNVVAMAGTASVPISGAVASMANRYKIPTIINSGYAVDTAKDPFLFNTSHKTDFAVVTAFRYFQKKGITKLALLMPIGPLGELGSNVARKYAQEYKITIVGEEKFDVKAPDVTSQLAKIRTMNPQAVFSFTTGEPAALIARNMEQLNLKVPFLVSHGNANPGFLKLVANINTEILVPSGKVMKPDALSDNDPTKKKILEFNKSHMEKYKEPANYFSAELADAIDLIVEGLKITKSADPVKLRDAIEGIKNYPAMQGVYTFTAKDHHGTKPDDMILLTIKQGKWEIPK